MFDAWRATAPNGMVSVTTSVFKRGLAQPLDRRSGQHRVRAARDHLLGARRTQRFGRRDDGSGGVDDVVDQDRDAPRHLADDVHLGDLVGGDAALVDDGEGGVETLRERARALDAAGIGRHDRHRLVVDDAIAEVSQQDGRGVDVVDREC